MNFNRFSQPLTLAHPFWELAPPQENARSATATHYCHLVIIVQSPTTKGNLIAVTNQAEFENLRYVVDAIVIQKRWQNLNGVTKL